MISGFFALRSSFAASADLVGVRPRARDAMDGLLEELDRIVVGFGLDVLGERDEGRAAARRIEHGGDRLRQRRDDLLGPRDAVPIARHRLEGVVDGDGRVAELLDLLEHGIRRAVGEGVTGEDQDRQAVRHRHAGGGDHVGGAGADRGERHHDLAALLRLGEADRGQSHRLLVLAAPGGQHILNGLERLAEAGHVAMPEDCENASEERNFAVVDDGSLSGEIADQGLGHGQPHGLHIGILPDASFWETLPPWPQVAIGCAYGGL